MLESAVVLAQCVQGVGVWARLYCAFEPLTRFLKRLGEDLEHLNLALHLSGRNMELNRRLEPLGLLGWEVVRLRLHPARVSKRSTLVRLER